MCTTATLFSTPALFSLKQKREKSVIIIITQPVLFSFKYVHPYIFFTYRYLIHVLTVFLFVIIPMPLHSASFRHIVVCTRLSLTRSLSVERTFAVMSLSTCLVSLFTNIIEPSWNKWNSCDWRESFTSIIHRIFVVPRLGFSISTREVKTSFASQL